MASKYNRLGGQTKMRTVTRARAATPKSRKGLVVVPARRVHRSAKYIHASNWPSARWTGMWLH